MNFFSKMRPKLSKIFGWSKEWVLMGVSPNNKKKAANLRLTALLMEFVLYYFLK